jgi:hypothetical protein
VTPDDPYRSFRHGSNLVRESLSDLQDEHDLTDLEMITILNEHQRTLLNAIERDRIESADPAAAREPGAI